VIKLYEFGPSRSARCLWTLAELGVPFERVEVDLRKGEHRGPEFLAINPMGRVPALAVDGLVLTESFAICTWLADRFPEAGLIPAAGTPERGDHDRWMFFCATELDAPLWRIRRNKVLLPVDKRVPADVPRAEEDFRRAAAVLQRALGDREVLVGARFSVVDVVMVHTLWWASWSELLEGFGGLERYVARHLEREAVPEEMRR